MRIGDEDRAASIAAQLYRLSPDYRSTPLLALPELARRLGVAEIRAKDESRRFLGSFKSLGGTYAGLNALARAAGHDIAGLLAARPSGLPALCCASDGNHGLAVAAAARMAGGTARVFLHAGVPDARARRIAAEGAEIVRVAGTYDDAVDAAAAEAGSGILIADTSADPDDPVVADVMDGYGVIAHEVRAEIDSMGAARPTHLFVQAGVGGLAAALARGMKDWMASPAVIAVVEPEGVACVAAASAAGRPVRLPGDLDTVAEMLSCGEASAPALVVLRRHETRCVVASERALADAPGLLRAAAGPATTPSGATGLAGLLAARASGQCALTESSRVLIVVTEGEVPEG